MLFPCSVAECFSMAGDAFDLAEQFQTPVFVMSDLDLGMNNWMSEPFEYPGEADRSRQGAGRRRPRAPGRICPLQRRGRRRHSAIARCPAPIIPRRRISPAAAATTRKRSTASVPTITRTTWTGWRASLKLRAQFVPAPVKEVSGTSKIGIIAYGTSHWALTESLRPVAARNTTWPRDYLRLRAYPFTPGSARVHQARTSAFTWWSRTATRRCSSC